MISPIKHSLLVIGAGIGQVPLLERAKTRGLHTIVVSKPGNYPGFALADESCFLDIFAHEAIADFARTRGIDAVVSEQNDLTAPTVAFVAERLGLPGNTVDQVTAYCNKSRFRANCDAVGIPVPRHISIDSPDLIPPSFSAVPFPWMVKPEDSQSSMGISRIDAPSAFSEAVAHALAHSRSRRAILEEFFPGREVVCEGFVRQGRYFPLAFGDRKYFALPNLFIPSQTLFPSVLQETFQERILDCEREMAAHVGLNFAIIHSEYLVDERTGEFRAVESAPRGGGVYIASHLIPHVTGIDVTDLVLDLALGENVDVPALFARKASRAAGYVCFHLPEGRIVSVAGRETLADNPAVLATYLDDIRPGALVGPMFHKGMRKGPILVGAPDRPSLETCIAEVQSTLTVQVETAAGRLEGIHWS
ncbi:MAG: ATP-grasp domain-containing protein [Kiritimatiellae bacterium]|nr:ATP-grasp domain-containing protein [Kiritimatiellia bacterium]